MFVCLFFNGIDSNRMLYLQVELGLSKSTPQCTMRTTSKTCVHHRQRHRHYSVYAWREKGCAENSGDADVIPDPKIFPGLADSEVELLATFCCPSSPILLVWRNRLCTWGRMISPSCRGGHTTRCCSRHGWWSAVVPVARKSCCSQTIME